MSHIQNNFGLSNPQGNQQSQGTTKEAKEENFFDQKANMITGGANWLAEGVENVPVVGGLQAASIRLAGEVAALPDKTTAFAGKATGSAIELQGKVVSTPIGLAGDLHEAVGNGANKVADGITGTADKIADVQEKIPVIGGLQAAGTRFAGEVLALPAKAVGAVETTAGKVINGIADGVKGAYDTVGGFIKKL